MITGINESKISTKNISCECKCRFEENAIQINGGITINVDVSVKNVMDVKKISYEIGKYLASVMDDSAITVMKL